VARRGVIFSAPPAATLGAGAQTLRVAPYGAGRRRGSQDLGGYQTLRVSAPEQTISPATTLQSGLQRIIVTDDATRRVRAPRWTATRSSSVTTRGLVPADVANREGPQGLDAHADGWAVTASGLCV
jgi:hypothetical protein